MHSGPNPQQKLGKAPAPAHMGPPPTGISHTAVQAFQPSNTPHSLPKLPPMGFFPPPTAHPHVGHILFLVSIHTRPNTTPNIPKHPLKYQNHTPYSSTILVSFSFIC